MHLIKLLIVLIFFITHELFHTVKKVYAFQNMHEHALLSFKFKYQCSGMFGYPIELQRQNMKQCKQDNGRGYILLHCPKRFLAPSWRSRIWSILRNRFTVFVISVILDRYPTLNPEGCLMTDYVSRVVCRPAIASLLLQRCKAYNIIIHVHFIKLLTCICFYAFGHKLQVVLS